MSVFDLLEIKKQKDPVLQHVFINRSSRPGKVVFEFIGTGTGVRLSWVLSSKRALLLADLIRKAAAP